MFFEGPGGLRGLIFRSQIALGSVPAALGVLPGLKIASRSLQKRSWERPGGQKNFGPAQERLGKNPARLKPGGRARPAAASPPGPSVYSGKLRK